MNLPALFVIERLYKPTKENWSPDFGRRDADLPAMASADAVPGRWERKIDREDTTLAKAGFLISVLHGTAGFSLGGAQAPR